MENEQKVEVTYKQMNDFLINVPNYIKENHKERSVVTFAMEKLAKKYEKYLKDLQELQAEFNERIADKRVEFASVDKEENLIETPVANGVRYKYKKDKQKELDKFVTKVNKDLAAALDERTFKDVPTHIVPIPARMEPLWIPVFTPFIFNVQTEEEQLRFYLAQGDSSKANGQVKEKQDA